VSRGKSSGIFDNPLPLQLTRIENGAALVKEQSHTLEQSANKKTGMM